MRKRTSNRTNSTPKRQPKASQVSHTGAKVTASRSAQRRDDRSVEVNSIVRNGVMVNIEFRTVADAEAFLAEFKLQMEVDTFLDDMPEEEYGDGVLRTLKVKQ